MTAMPIPTPGPYPLYDCRYVVDKREFSRVKEIPELSHDAVKEHHRHREQGWMNNPPRFSTKEKTMSMHANAPLGFIYR